ncbi:hypothetical protein [Isoalcanivorax beigongshangi]|uniref:Glycosyltransferase n=1 Tax=Isoalcanivorax beigongshangi TaxID=3238810 RepID=A0ABV4AGT7_9GAMM
MRDILYVLATPHFFSEGMCGRVSHAIGFVRGMTENGVSVRVVSGPDPEGFLKESKSHSSIESRLFFYFRVAWALAVAKESRAVIRWRPVLPFILFPIIFYKRKMMDVFWEINGVTGKNSRFPIVRWISSVSIWLANLTGAAVVVSESSAKGLRQAGWSRKLFVIRNGYDSTVSWPDIEAQRGTPISLVYFGAFQRYYDWNVLISVYEQARESGLVSNLMIWGFEREFNVSGIEVMGRFNIHELPKSLSGLVNPALVLHTDDSQLSYEGSPMKLYEYLSTGLPVVVSDSQREKISANFHVYWYKAGCGKSLKEAIFMVSSRYEEALQLSRGNVFLAESLGSWGVVTREFAELVNN